jgi:serralysin
MAEDLNGNKVLDTLHTVESFGGASVSLDLNGGYVLSSAKGVQLLQLAGQQVGENFGGGWNVVGANDTLTGYQVIWKETSTGTLGYWNTDANGNYLNAKGINANQLKAFESSFQQDLDASNTGVLDPITKQMVDPLTLVKTTGVGVTAASLLQPDNGGYVIDGPNGVQFLTYKGKQLTDSTFPGLSLNGIESQGSGYITDWTKTVGGQKSTWTTNSTGEFQTFKLV